MRRWVALISALALAAGPVGVAAQQNTTADPTQKLNEPVTLSDCVAQIPGGDPYPYSVAAIKKALTGKGREVKVLVVDNAFYGYDISDNADPNQPVRVASKNFPSDFFSEEGSQDDFSPFVGTTNPPAEELDPAAPPIESHGTLVTGIVLGGMYDDSPTSESTPPSARSLLVYRDNETKPWIKISFLIIRYGPGVQSDPIETLNSLGVRADSMSIVNMSLAKALTGAEDIPELNDKQSLIVTSAGNSGLKLSRSPSSGVAAIPAALADDGRILVVASHDGDGRLSKFSNYGRLVNIAAPGCKIKSWMSGKSDPTPSSGTSMATAVVTFAAALVSSQWSESAGAIAIRNRILSSARYNPVLQRCAKLTDSPAASDPQAYCVKDGAMLDITAAASVARDFIEYDECGGAAAAPCRPTIAFGTLQQQAQPLLSCIGDDERANKLAYQGLTKNGAAKRISPDTFLIDWEPAFRVGDQPLSSKLCTVPAGSDAEILFQAEKPRSDPRTPADTELRHIRLKDLRRLVIRAI